MTDHYIPMRNYTVIESSELDHANPDGSVTVPANDKAQLLDYEPATDADYALLHALGAVDAKGVRYQLKYGNNTAFTMESPPGVLSEPFSYTEKLGEPLGTNGTFELWALNETNSGIDLAARGHVEVL